MMVTPTQRLLTKVKAQYRLSSDYQLHKILRVSTQAIYNYTGGRAEMSPDLVLIVCDLLGDDPGPWMIEIEITRCRSRERREMLHGILKKMDQAAGRVVAAFCPIFLGYIGYAMAF